MALSKAQKAARARVAAARARRAALSPSPSPSPTPAPRLRGRPRKKRTPSPPPPESSGGETSETSSSSGESHVSPNPPALPALRRPPPAPPRRGRKRRRKRRSVLLLLLLLRRLVRGPVVVIPRRSALFPAWAACAAPSHEAMGAAGTTTGPAARAAGSAPLGIRANPPALALRRSQAFIALKATGASKDELRRPRRELRLLLKVLKEEEDELPAFGAAPAAGERAGLPSRRENVKRLIGELVDEVMR
ncbi:hypothetical protein NX059_003731 [Plenodomus lindquistii]|nr:hypothetical protein NX059_003520 [Plenodomus lindquistii]KAI8940009.1 hypothetical protein NX059_003731 [Plenodomus lindquistii]